MRPEVTNGKSIHTLYQCAVGEQEVLYSGIRAGANNVLSKFSDYSRTEGQGLPQIFTTKLGFNSQCETNRGEELQDFDVRGQLSWRLTYFTC